MHHCKGGIFYQSYIWWIAWSASRQFRKRRTQPPNQRIPPCSKILEMHACKNKSLIEWGFHVSLNQNHHHARKRQAIINRYIYKHHNSIYLVYWILKQHKRQMCLAQMWCWEVHLVSWNISNSKWTWGSKNISFLNTKNNN